MAKNRYPEIINETIGELSKWVREVTRTREEDIGDFDKVVKDAGIVSPYGATVNYVLTADGAGGASYLAIPASGGTPTVITVADTVDTTCFVGLFESATGDLAPKTDAGITYNAGTGLLTATGFSGPLTGNVTGNASGSSGSCTGNAATVTTNANLTGPITSAGNATSISSQTGTGTKFVVDTAPTLVTPNIGVATATSINKMAITAPATSSTLAVADGKTLTVSNTLTFTGTDASSAAFGAGGTVAYIPDVVSVTPSADQNNYAPGIALTVLKESIVTIAATNSIKITGFSATSAVHGKRLTVKNTLSPTASTARMVLFERESASSTAANRISYPPNGIPLILMPGDTISFIYNTTSSRWEFDRGNRHGSMSSFFDTFSDYISGGGFLQSAAVSGVAATTVTSSNTVSDATQKSLGVAGASSGTDTTGYAYLGSGSTASIKGGSGNALFIARCTPSALSDGTNTYKAYVGFHDAEGTGTPVDGVYWVYDQATSTAWRTATSNNSTETINTVTGFTVAALDMDYLGIYCNGDWTNVEYFYSADGVTWTIFATQISTNIPTATTRIFGCLFGLIKSAGTTSRTFYADLMGFRYDLVRGT